jgi:hypothetical protein
MLDSARDPSSLPITNPMSGTCKIPRPQVSCPAVPDLALAGLLVWRSRTTGGHVGAARDLEACRLAGLTKCFLGVHAAWLSSSAITGR